MISNNLDALISRISSNIMHPTEIFFFIYVIFLGTLAVVTFDKRGRVRKHNFLFLLSSLPIAGFTLLRPFGLTRDDLGYQSIFYNLDIMYLLNKISNLRDPMWYLSVYLIKIIWSDPRACFKIDNF